MRIKKFIAESVPEALQKIKGDMGRDAVILNTRSLNGTAAKGVKHGVEVTAASEYPDSAVVTKNNQRINVKNSPRIGISESTSSECEPQQRPLDKIRRVYETFKPDMSRLSAESYLQLIPPEVGQLYRRISALNICPEIIDALIKDTLSGNIPGDRSSTLAKRWTGYLAEKCFSGKSLEKLIAARPFAFSGYSGCGRSTLIAKIAYSCIREKKCPASIISLDGYNISGQHMLRRIARLLGIHFMATSKLKEVSQRISNYKPGHALLIDLPALNTSDEHEKDILGQFALFPVLRVLVIDAIQHFNIIGGIIESSKPFSPKYLAASHFNEISSPGALVSALINSRLIPLIGGKGRRIADGYNVLRPKGICAQLFNDIISEDSGDQ